MKCTCALCFGSLSLLDPGRVVYLGAANGSDPFVPLTCCRCFAVYEGDAGNVPVCDECLDALVAEGLSLNDMFLRYEVL